jgi:hypothetical protein
MLDYLKKCRIDWVRSTTPYEYMAVVLGSTWRLRLNDFPDEVLLTLIDEAGNEVNLEERPARWGLE